MASYESEHNLPPTTTTSPPVTSPPTTTRRQRLNLSDFFSRTPLPPSSSSPNQRPSSLDPSYAFHALATAYSELAMTPIVESLIETLRMEAENPGVRGGGGVPPGWEDGLERIGKGELVQLEKEESAGVKDGGGEGRRCPICSERFLDDPYPLVVRLPCHKSHIFDLECIQPWLKLHTTCPLDRIDLLKRKQPPPPPSQTVEEQEEEWDDSYG